MSVVDQLASSAKVTWFDTIGVAAGVGLAVLYFSTQDASRSIYVLYAGLVLVAAHAFVSLEVLPKRKRMQAEAVEIAMAYREVLKVLPSGIESRNGQHPPHHRGQPAPSRIAV